ncbi:4Fe-4S dicluster domain-containing protein [Ancylomarina euxinus]|uniref:4Fe-4S dicluster domain-containing protein n=1 Tax=Ancylomarina euxinus TaxID=2283627 RepID=A0A425XXU9_9BACT|nr:FAD-dependent oxidoreductase [Ancylomarina euxinus]MCZ4696047.1 FAD-dependent oxidoreductase [Ancylomarina euxinus]MUP13986.1 NAD(P)-binding protein [Ancylomarina euxinus]RRG19539.1 4Fe-4S dicluster domain-containing protein [Ancylomarina euxinus]
MSKAEFKYENQGNGELQDLIKQAFTCLACGKCSGGCPMVYLFPEQYNPHKVLDKLVENPEEALASKEIWFCASCYKCHNKCPQGIELPEVFLKLRRIALKQNGMGNLRVLIDDLHGRIPFYKLFFRVCYHPEKIHLGKVELDSLFEKSASEYKLEQIPSTREKIAIIGSGPAGLFAACELRRKGYQVTVFESRQKAGGMFQLTIPEFRLESEIVDQNIDLVKSLGIEIKTNVRIGKDILFNTLFEDGFQSVFIASGAHRCLHLNIEGENLPQVMTSLEFLEASKSGILKAVKNKFVVIGGGNTAMEIATSALRYGAKEVCVLYRRSKDEIPADINELREVEEHGVKIHYQVSPLRFIGDEKLRGIECIKMELGHPDLSGRRRPVPIKASNFIINADMAVVAIGEKPDLGYLPDEVKLNKNGTISINPLSMETSMKGVFAGGDVIWGSASVAEAIMAAGRAVDGMDQYLIEKRKA